MATQILKKLTSKLPMTTTCHHTKTTSSQYVTTRARDPTFEKHMDTHKNLLKVVVVQDLLHAAPPTTLNLHRLPRPPLIEAPPEPRHCCIPPPLPPHLPRLLQPHQPYFKQTESAIKIARQEAVTVYDSLPLVIDRLVRLLSMSLTKEWLLRAVFKVWRELGLPDDFEDSVISQNPNLFGLCEAEEPNTHILKLVDEHSGSNLVAAIENLRVIECCREGCSVDGT
ncbi:LOW QUALITY PROTEIN: hypothetical protein RJ640_010849 [Escallonia rubra]|uniref:PORR domain-containing protein n=1 Tax=Escallonia rubra TaxID=112253 RepID=A0AA88R5B0_9ASTE|nr:LOW QUALITY PROTEIN: hypothetical protein RJ640_010849 [Escallonia rubra]